MYRIRGQGLLRLFLATLTGAGAAQGVQAATLWQRDWDTQGAVFLGSYEAANLNYQGLAADRNGGLLKLDSGVTLHRLWPDGGLRWQLSLPLGGRSDRGGLRAYEDGSAVVLLGGADNHSGHLLQVDPVGRLSWMLQVPATRLVESGDELITVGCASGSLYLTVVERAGGSVLRQLRVAQPGCVDTGRLHATLSGNDLYIATDDSNTVPAEVAKYWRVDVQTGNLLWRVERPGPAARIWLDGGSLYADNGAVLGALDTANGALRWEKACGGMAGFVGADPVCNNGVDSLQRLAAADGSTVWSAASPLKLLGMQGRDVFAFVRQSGNLRGIAGSDGSTLWEIPLQPANSPPPLLVPNVTSVLSVYSGSAPAQYMLKRINMIDGLQYNATALPQVLRRVLSQGEWLSGSDLYVRGEGDWPGPLQKLRRLSAASGDLVWESVDDIGRINGYWEHDPEFLAASDSTVFLSDTFLADSQSHERVYALDRGNGRLRWSRNVLEGSSASLQWLSVVAGGDVISLAAAEASDGQDRLLKYQTRRLDAASGQDVWSRTLWSGQGSSGVAPPRSALVGGDPVVAVPGNVAYFPMQRLDAATGITRWSAPLSSLTLTKSAAGDAVFSLRGNPPGELSVSRVHAATGQVEWTFGYRAAWALGLSEFSLLPALPNGDVLVLANGTPRTGRPTRAQLLQIKADGSGLRQRWPADADLLVSDLSIKSAVLDEGGEFAWLYAEQGLGGYSPLALGFLIRFDLQQGRPLGSQIYTVTGAHPQFQATAWEPRLMLYGNKFLATGRTARAPLPTTRRDALRDFSVAARGDLALDIPGLPADFAAGALLPLDARVNYDGDAAVAGVTLLLALPWQGSASGLTCQGSGVSNCSVDSRYGQIEVRFDAAPGARLRLGGSVRALAWPAAAQAGISGVVFGPESLLETDSANNLRHALPGQLLFADDFEQAAPAR